MKNRKNNNNENITSNNEIKNTAYSFDETNSVYVIYDKDTNQVLRTTRDESMVKMYLDNPDFDPSFPGSELEYREMNSIN